MPDELPGCSTPQGYYSLKDVLIDEGAKKAGNDAWQKTLIIRIRTRKVVTVYVLAERTRTRTSVPEQSAARSLGE